MTMPESARWLACRLLCDGCLKVESPWHTAACDELTKDIVKRDAEMFRELEAYACDLAHEAPAIAGRLLSMIHRAKRTL